MEKKSTKKVTIAAGTVTPKKKKKKYYPPKQKKSELNVHIIPKESALNKENPVVAEPVAEQTWLQKVVAWLTSIGK